MTAFGSSDPFTVGVEEEFQILDPETHALVSAVDDVMERAGDLEGNLRTEFYQAVVETATDPCGDVGELREEVRRLRGDLTDLLEDEGYRCGAAGTHPFARWADQDLTDKPRYRELLEEIGWPARRDLVFGLHVHVGVESPEKALYVTNHIRPFLPLVLALSANSPFWQGEATDLQATRTRIFDAMPRTGLPPRFDGWTAFQRGLDHLEAAGAIEDVTKVWWDVRPRPDLGTVEVRSADIPTDPDVTVGLAALIQAIVAELSRAHEEGRPPPFEPDEAVMAENRWRAIRHGIGAEFALPDGDGSVDLHTVEEMLDATLDEVGEAAAELGSKDELARLAHRARHGDTGAGRQLDVHRAEGSLHAVARDVAERTQP